MKTPLKGAFHHGLQPLPKYLFTSIQNGNSGAGIPVFGSKFHLKPFLSLQLLVFSADICSKQFGTGKTNSDISHGQYLYQNVQKNDVQKSKHRFCQYQCIFKQNLVKFIQFVLILLKANEIMTDRMVGSAVAQW